MPAVTPRQVRAWTLASASFGLGLAGHLEAGGHATSPAAIALAAGWCALSGWSYSRRRLSGPRIGLVLLGNQVIMHLTLAIGSSMSMTAVSTATDCGGAHSGNEPSVVTTGNEGRDAATSSMELLPSGWMLVAHLLATALAAGAIVAVEVLVLGLTALAHWLDRVTRVATRDPLLIAPQAGMTTGRLPSWTSRPIGARPGRGPPSRSLHR